jgi:hypothetical protein
VPAVLLMKPQSLVGIETFSRANASLPTPCRTTPAHPHTPAESWAPLPHTAAFHARYS